MDKSVHISDLKKGDIFYYTDDVIVTVLSVDIISGDVSKPESITNRFLYGLKGITEAGKLCYIEFPSGNCFGRKQLEKEHSSFFYNKIKHEQ